MLRNNGHEVYDFRNPPNKAGFKWKDLDHGWQTWSKEEYVRLLEGHPDASFGFIADYRAMQWADTCVLALPCGRSAHLEGGYFNGANKRLLIYMPTLEEPELMYLMANKICLSRQQLLTELQGPTPVAAASPSRSLGQEVLAICQATAVANGSRRPLLGLSEPQISPTSAREGQDQSCQGALRLSADPE